ncbi:hypothetical protein VM1G_04683 [Cytospora mali]|uniref:Uncharacterized protein n=1 Tax=Cytospora mali TaxID=578113 RepID=A0A194VWD8_CYTMA|nr:hypothetical protein VM1G_04683 [Valsa mali]
MDTADYFFEVKEQVTENDMLIVQSDSPSIKRIKADELQRRVKALVDNCKNDERYCMDPCPHLTENPSYFRIREVCQPVRAHLNKTALDTLGIGDRFEKLPLYSGISRAAYPQRGHDNM